MLYQIFEFRLQKFRIEIFELFDLIISATLELKLFSPEETFKLTGVGGYYRFPTRKPHSLTIENSNLKFSGGGHFFATGEGKSPSDPPS